MQHVICPHCGGGVGNDPRSAGNVVTCPRCRRPFHMPALQAVPAPSPEGPFAPLTVSDTEDRPRRMRREPSEIKISAGTTALVASILGVALFLGARAVNQNSSTWMLMFAGGGILMLASLVLGLAGALSDKGRIAAVLALIITILAGWMLWK